MAPEVSVRLQRGYVDRGTQTDPPSQCHSGEDYLDQKNVNLIELNSPLGGLQECDGICLCSATHGTLSSSDLSSEKDSAYMHSSDREMCSVDISRPSSTVSGVVPHHKQSQLSYGRPSEPKFPSNRVVSLPERSPGLDPSCYSYPRTVSMPGPCPRSPRTALDILNNSLESAYSPSLNDYHGHNKVYPRPDLPQSPSPSASPEPVMIIGSDVEVPESFLRSAAYNSYRPYADEDGWISWANSPPRPIPALHGPSSLPYARCPSGAEGTVIEGEDLSNMIWGLDASVLHVKTPPQIDPSVSRTQNKEMRTNPPIPTWGTSLKGGSMISKYIMSNSGTGRREGSTPYLRYEERETTREIAFAERNTCTTSGIGLAIMRNETNGLGLGITSRDRKREQAGSRPLQNSRNPNVAASVFVPATQSPHFQPRIFIEPQSEYKIHYQSNGFSALPDYTSRIHKSSNSQLPTPPGSTPSQWSPQLMRYHEPALSPELPTSQPKRVSAETMLPMQFQAISEQLDYTSKHSPFDGYRGIKSADVIHLGQLDYPNISSMDPVNEYEHIDVQSALNSHCSQMEKSHTVVALNPLPTPSAVLQLHNSLPGGYEHTKPPAPVMSQDCRRSLSEQKPRSIPLARLLQRRLSSVLEEDPVINRVLKAETVFSMTTTKNSQKDPPEVERATRRVARNQEIPPKSQDQLFSTLDLKTIQLSPQSEGFLDVKVRLPRNTVGSVIRENNDNNTLRTRCLEVGLGTSSKDAGVRAMNKKKWRPKKKVGEN